MSQIKGFFLSVYRNARLGDCSMNGLSARHDTIFVVSDGKLIREPGPFNIENAEFHGHPVFVVGEKGGRFNLVPHGEERWCMFGGNFAYSSDSRCPSHPIPIHDRIEA